MALIDPDYVPYGGKVLTFVPKTYSCELTIAETFNYTTQSNVVERFNADDELTGQSIQERASEGTATIQIDASTSLLPEIGMTFYATLQDVIVYFIVTSISPVYSQADTHKVSITFRKKVNQTP